ncbi:MAG: DNA-formamidopyrimidine glycosylase family protein [Pseudomonadota bacterium]
MPELPDITVYLDALERRVRGKVLRAMHFNSPFLLRSVTVPPDSLVGQTVTGCERFGKRIVLQFDGDIWFVLHLMIAGRLHWRDASTHRPGKSALLWMAFDSGVLWLTEAGSKKRASLHLCTADELDQHRRGGLEPLEISLKDFSHRLQQKNHTLKRALTDPNILSGIGNAYSDEILHNAGLSPVALTHSLDDAAIEKLFHACQHILRHWTEQLRLDVGDGFPEKVTAFREDMAVHGRYGKPCPVCETAVQRIRYASNETNYCPRCQTDGKLLADRSLSRLLKRDWPKTVDELERRAEKSS